MSLGEFGDVDVSIAFQPETGIPREIVFVKPPGRQGSALAMMFNDLSVGLSRIMQRRHPSTGRDLETSVLKAQDDA
jgi:hypothetical protein